MMHACGHDIHMSVLMGLIDRCSENSPGTICSFCFNLPKKAREGRIRVGGRYSPAVSYRSSICPPRGQRASCRHSFQRPGIFFGIPQEFDVRFLGKSAHVAFPEQGIDALAPATDFIQMMREDIAELSRRHRVIFHIGKIEGGSIRNVIADQCILEGTHRSLVKEARDSMNRLIESNAHKAAVAYGAGYESDFLCSYDPVVNDAGLVSKLQSACGRLGYRFEEAAVAMTGEDFGFFTSIYPGLLFWLGSGCDQPLHSPRFLPAEECIEVGVNVMWALAEAE
jgi:N-acetyldiaminopimelate deacetylase